MKRTNTSDPNVLSYRDGGGCVALFGMPFFLFGVFFIGAALMGQVKDKSGQPVSVIFPVLFGCLFGGIGAILVFGRAGQVFDRTLKTVTEWSGLLFPMFSKVHAWNEYSCVCIKREIRRSKNNSYTVYQVGLAHGGETKMKIHAPPDKLQARKLAEEIAKFMELPMEDASGEEVIRREAAHLDESLRDQAQRTGKLAELSAPPDVMRTAYSVEGDTVHFSFPPPPASIVTFAPVGCAAVFAGIVASVFLAEIVNSPSMPWEMRLIFTSFISIFFILLPVGGTFVGALSHIRRRWEVTATPQELRVVTHGMLGRRETAIPAGKLEELRLESSKLRGYAIVAVSDDASAPFGQGLSREEANWIATVIRHAVTK
jgi:hypothetical protein